MQKMKGNRQVIHLQRINLVNDTQCEFALYISVKEMLLAVQ